MALHSLCSFIEYIISLLGDVSPQKRQPIVECTQFLARRNTDQACL